MLIKINGSDLTPVSKEDLRDIFNNIIECYDEIHSIDITIESNDNHKINECIRNQQPIENNPRYLELINQIKQRNNENQN